ncbi:unnamed protein product [Dimorphilus gyrociliatus]|uniref:Uncharacterized protein n=1 Tax=Dimorphilus gyrociliatus TaxID=2664684 RepID=A0A7I8VJ34_9ANNE|nr:unnamed protein product [Dimorphilus gyrociliatus]
MAGNLNEENGVLEQEFLELTEEIRQNINDIDKEAEIEINKVNNEIITLINEVKAKQISLKNEILSFNEEKKRNLCHALSDIKRLYEAKKKSNIPFLQSELSLIIKKLKYSSENLMRKKKIFDRSEILDHFEIGKLNTPFFEKPIENHSIELNEKPGKVISNRHGFYNIQNKNKIVNLETQEIIIWTENKIYDISTTYDNGLSYLQFTENHYVIQLLSKDNYGKTKYVLPRNAVNPNEAGFAVLKDDIIINDMNKLLVFSKETSNIVNAWKYDREISNLSNRLQGNILYQFSGSSLFVFKDDEFATQNVSKSEKESYSIYYDVIENLKKGKILFCNSKNIVFVGANNQNGISLDKDKLFPAEKLLDYRITKTEIIFCLINQTDEFTIKFKHFPIECNF